MLGLFGNNVDHPMADIKSTQKLLDEVPKNDPLKALLELTSWIESVTVEPDFRSDYQLSLLRLLHETARPHERWLTQEYFAVTAPQRPLESRLCMALSQYYLQDSLACINVLRRYRNRDRGAAAMKADLPLVTTRGIGAVMGRLKYAAACYVPVEHTAWEQLAEFYSTAESLRYLDDPVSMYAGENANSSVRHEFATVLMWYAFCAGTASRLDFHLAQLLAAHLRACFTVDADCGPDCVLDFDLLHPAPPIRISSARSRQSGLLFIGVEGLQESIEACIKSLENNLVPEEVNREGNYDAGLVRNVLRRLSVCWTLPQQARRNARHKVKVNIRVVKGFSSLMKNAGSGVDLVNDEEAVWKTDDISNNGFHTVLPPQSAEGLQIGSIIGTQPENIRHWGVGIVRRLMRDRQNKLHVGVELLSNRVHIVRLRELNSDIWVEGQTVLWLDPENPDEASLLMQPHTFFSGRSLQLRMDKRHFQLIPLVLLEMGKDYDFARYRKIEQEIA